MKFAFVILSNFGPFVALFAFLIGFLFCLPPENELKAPSELLDGTYYNDFLIKKQLNDKFKKN
jgi:hypothetical protein